MPKYSHSDRSIFFPIYSTPKPVCPGAKGDLLAPATTKSYFDKFKVVLEYAAKRDAMLDIKQVESYFEDVKISVPDKEEGLHLEITEIQAFKKVFY